MAALLQLEQILGSCWSQYQSTGRKSTSSANAGKKEHIAVLLPILREKRRTPSSTDHPVKAGVGEEGGGGTMPCLKPAQPLSPRSRSALVSNLRSSSHPTMLSCSREILKQFSRKLLSSASSAHSQRKIQRTESEYFSSFQKILTFPQTLVSTAPL